MILGALHKRDRREIKMRRAIAYETAVLILKGTHSPKDFPKFDKFMSDAAPTRRVITDVEEQRAFLNRIARKKG